MKKIFPIVFLLLVLPIAFSLDIETYKVDYQIQGDFSVHESIDIYFSQPLNQSRSNTIILGEFNNLAIFSGNQAIPFSVQRKEDNFLVSFNLSEGAERVTMIFTTKDLVFTSEESRNFFTILNPNQQTKNLEITLWLPEGHSIFRNFITPENPEKITDGKRIGLKWTFENSQGSIPISVRFSNPNSSQNILDYLIIAIATIMIVSVLLIIYFNRKQNRKTQAAFYKGFYPDEVKVIKFLEENKEIKQSVIEKEFKFSRAKVTRIMRKLEEKGMIEKEKWGRTNKIRWVGKT